MKRKTGVTAMNKLASEDESINMNVSITRGEKRKAKELAKSALGGNGNISGYVSYLINREYKLLKN